MGERHGRRLRRGAGQRSFGHGARQERFGPVSGRPDRLARVWVNNYSFVSSSRTGNLTVAATATLGYPFLMDSGNIMQRADGPTYTTTVGGAGQLMQGSNFTGRSSGGPWIVNFVAANPDLSGGPRSEPPRTSRWSA